MKKRLVFAMMLFGTALFVACSKGTLEVPNVSTTPELTPTEVIQPTIIVNPTEIPTNTPSNTPSNTPTPEPTEGPSMKELLKVTERKSTSIPFIMIDPGHGDFDPGSVVTDENGNKYNEKDINLQIALKVSSKLQVMGIQVVMTRSNDKMGNFFDKEIYNFFKKNFPNSKTDTQRYNNYKRELSDATDIDLFLAIHQNEYTSMPKVKGAEVWRAKNYNANNATLASKVHTAIKSAVGYSRSIMEGEDLIVLRTQKPSILVECGYMSNPDEFKSLLSEEFQDKMADAIVKGIVDYLKAKGDYPNFKFGN